jgi:hypothetical protein
LEHTTTNPKSLGEKIKMRLTALLAFASSFALPIFGQETNKPDPQLRERLITLIKTHTDALDQNDAAAVAATFKEDGVQLRSSCRKAER